MGDDHASNQIGVAPRAKWIACRNMNAGLGSPTTYVLSFIYISGEAENK